MAKYEFDIFVAESQFVGDAPQSAPVISSKLDLDKKLDMTSIINGTAKEDRHYLEGSKIKCIYNSNKPKKKVIINNSNQSKTILELLSEIDLTESEIKKLKPKQITIKLKD